MIRVVMVVRKKYVNQIRKIEKYVNQIRKIEKVVQKNIEEDQESKYF